jgi:hypothetical protein
VLLAPYGTFSPASFTIDISNGRSEYNGVNFGMRRQLQRNVSLNAWYSLSKAEGTSGSGTDELSTSNIQDHLNPFGAVQFGPSGRTDARHRVNISGIILMPMGFQVSPIFRFRSALPVGITEGVDLNQNGSNTDIPKTAYAYTGLDSNNLATFKEIGPCTTINCGRGASQSSLDVRLTKTFRLRGTSRVEGYFEVFNLLNASDPNTFTTARATGTITSETVNPNFLTPTAFAGDFQQPTQRLAQIGFRFAF